MISETLYYKSITVISESVLHIFAKISCLGQNTQEPVLIGKLSDERREQVMTVLLVGVPEIEVEMSGERMFSVEPQKRTIGFDCDGHHMQCRG